MIVRILGEAQFEVPDGEAAALEELDHKMAGTMEGADEKGFAAVLVELIEKVRSVGTEVSAETIVPSDLTLPHPGSTLAEVRELLASEDTTGD